MRKDKIKRILVASIKNFKSLKNYRMIGLMGSIIKKRNKIGDVDIVSVGGLKTHIKFREHLLNDFRKKGIRIIFFKTIVNKPTNKESVLIHDLHYRNINHLLKKEWKTIINEMIDNIEVIYGENLVSKLPKQKISEKDLCWPILRWVIKINSYDRYKMFKKHFLLYTLKDFYEYGFKDKGYKLKKILISKDRWKNKVSNLRKILTC